MRQSWLLVISCLVFGVSSSDLNDSQWISFKNTYNKSYSSRAEEVARLAVFRDNLRRIAEHNAGAHTFRLGVNRLADLTPAEYRALLTPARPARPSPGPARVGSVQDSRRLGSVQDSRRLGSGQDSRRLGSGQDAVDWRAAGAVTLVKDLGSCGGGSWAFAASGAVESAWNISGHYLTRLSEQQLLDCSASFDTSGCDGGQAADAFDYLLSAEGLHAERDYPFRHETDQQCRQPAHPPTASISGWWRTTRDSEPELEYVLARRGPAAARIDASHTSFQLYSHGVYQDRKCSSRQLTLDVLVVGFGEEDGVPFWLVKNAWGPAWGDGGYIKIRRNAGNMCGVATDATYPIV